MIPEETVPLPKASKRSPEQLNDVRGSLEFDGFQNLHIEER